MVIKTETRRVSNQEPPIVQDLTKIAKENINYYCKKFLIFF